MRKVFAAILPFILLFVCTACWADQEVDQKGILDLPYPWNIIGATAAILLIGTFLFRMVKKRWWWEKKNSQPSPKGSEQKIP